MCGERHAFLTRRWSPRRNSSRGPFYLGRQETQGLFIFFNFFEIDFILGQFWVPSNTEQNVWRFQGSPPLLPTHTRSPPRHVPPAPTGRLPCHNRRTPVDESSSARVRTPGLTLGVVQLVDCDRCITAYVPRHSIINSLHCPEQSLAPPGSF